MRLIFALPWRRFKKGSVLQLDVRPPHTRIDSLTARPLALSLPLWKHSGGQLYAGWSAIASNADHQHACLDWLAAALVSGAALDGAASIPAAAASCGQRPSCEEAGKPCCTDHRLGAPSARSGWGGSGAQRACPRSVAPLRRPHMTRASAASSSRQGRVVYWHLTGKALRGWCTSLMPSACVRYGHGLLSDVPTFGTCCGADVAPVCRLGEGAGDPAAPGFLPRVGQIHHGLHGAGATYWRTVIADPIPVSDWWHILTMWN